MGKYSNPGHDKVEEKEDVEVAPKPSVFSCTCGAAGCGGRDIYCKTHGKHS